jgi:hypothetical protein
MTPHSHWKLAVSSMHEREKPSNACVYFSGRVTPRNDFEGDSF